MLEGVQFIWLETESVVCEDGREKMSLDVFELAGEIGRKACHGQQFNFIRSLFIFGGDRLMIQLSLREKKNSELLYFADWGFFFLNIFSLY